MPKAKDYTGQKFSRLLAVERIPEKGKETRYRCLCDCGKETTAKACHLVSSATKSCGCLNRETISRKKGPSPNKVNRTGPKTDLVGMKFGRLTVASFSHVSERYQDIWNCLCECGSETTPSAHNLLRGGSKSCGCLSREITSILSKTHGMAGTRIHRIWKGMWARCTQPSMKMYSLYKDKLPPDRWKSFELFLQDMGVPPSDKHSLDRIDTLLPYSPTNCRWATANEQARNKTNSIMVEYCGRVLSLPDACDAAGLSYKYISGRNGHFKDIEYASFGKFKKSSYQHKDTP